LAAVSISASAAALPEAYSAVSRRGGSSSDIDLSSPADADTDEDTSALYLTTARNSLMAIEAMTREDREDNNREF
jgi:hypothetical protein